MIQVMKHVLSFLFLFSATFFFQLDESHFSFFKEGGASKGRDDVATPATQKKRNMQEALRSFPSSLSPLLFWSSLFNFRRSGGEWLRFKDNQRWALSCDALWLRTALKWDRAQCTLRIGSSKPPSVGFVPLHTLLINSWKWRLPWLC